MILKDIYMKKFSQSAFARFFTGFPKLLFAGLLFAVPLAAFTGLFVLISYLTGFNNIIVWGLGIIPSFPFYAGLVMYIRKHAIEKKNVPVFSTFMSAVKSNFKLFLLHGVALYAIVACSLFAILYYYTLSQGDPVFGAVLTLYMIFSTLMVILMFYVPIMTVTYELRIRDIYKNSFLLIFGLILRNLLALVMSAVAVALFVLAVTFAEGVVFWIAVAISTVLCPMIVTYIVISVIAKGLQENVGKFTPDEHHYSPTQEELEQERLALEKADSTDDYVFVNGRMVKNTSKKSE